MTFQRIMAGLLVLSTTGFTSLSNVAGAPQDAAKTKEPAKKTAVPVRGPDSVRSDKSSAPDASVQKFTRPTGKPLDYKKLAGLIDREINAKLAAGSVKPSPRTDDAEFLRRVSLDITGVIPSGERARAFLDSNDPAKRDQLIDELLASSNYGRHFADLWMNILYPVSDSENRFVSKEPLASWLASEFNANKAWDQVVYDLLTATGEQDANPAVTYFMVNRGVDKITDSVSKAFLGIQLQCAQCHNHPFTTWKQTEYWGMAQFFMKVNAVVQRNPKKAVTAGVTETERVNRGMNPLPESAKTVPAKFLGGPVVKLPAGPSRPVFAKWVTEPDNPYFARSMVNRAWSELFGRGLVNPVDDMLAENEASHPELLDALAKEFTLSGFDVKHLVRSICTSDAYQRTSKPLAGNRDEHALVAHQAVKALTPEELFDCLAMVLGLPTQDGRPLPKGGQGRPAPRSPREQFVQFFKPGESAKPTDYDAGIPQALRLMNSPRLSSAPGLLRELARGNSRPADFVEKLYLMTVSRRPTLAESQKLTSYIARQSDAPNAYSDILWALLNSSEFALNR